MNKCFIMLALITLSTCLQGQEHPLWLRKPNLSPDGQTVVFMYKGDLFTVPATGGEAFQLTTNAAYDADPIWSPDGQHIAFNSDREGSRDLYVISSKGGAPKRLTTHSGTETPIVWKDNQHILFSAYLKPTAKSVIFPSPSFPQIYEVSTEAKRPHLFSTLPMEAIAIGPKGELLYQDKKGYEDPMRKHHTSSITRDIWKVDTSLKSFKKLTVSSAEDRQPIWANDGISFYFLSERKGSYNIYKRNLDEASSTKQITFHTTHPVRFLSASQKGTLCYGYNGEIYLNKGEARTGERLKIKIKRDVSMREAIDEIKHSGAKDISLSPNEKEIAFIMHGDVYVTSVKYKTTKQITNTPYQERNVSFSPEGKSLVYAAEQKGLWQIYETKIVNKEEKQFAYASELKETRLTQSDQTSFQPQYSPDGKEVAFLENRSAIRVINLKSKKVRTVMAEKFQYSYADGDQWYQWSPDSRWILTDFIGNAGWNNKDVALFKADGSGQHTNLTESGYSDTGAKWVLGGKAMIWNSDRAGYRSHGSWGAESDIYIMFFDQKAYENFLLSKEDAELKEEAEKETKEADKKKETNKDKKKTEKDKLKTTPIKPLKFDLANRQERIVRLTVNSSFLSDAVLTPKGDKLYYLSSFEAGADLWMHDLKENSTKIVLKKAGSGLLIADKKGEKVFLCASGHIKSLDVKKGTSKTIAFDAPFCYRPAQERSYIFNHVWHQVKDKFYDTKLHGVDWVKMRTNYERFLPSINNNYDFAELLSEMLGELNASHTGGRYYAKGATLSTARLGVFYDQAYKGEGLRITEVIEKSPLTLQEVPVTTGWIINAIDGVVIKPEMDYFPLLKGKAGKKVRLTVTNPATNKKAIAIVKALNAKQENDLLYRRWTENNYKKVIELSKGRIGYVHIKAMDANSFHTLYSQVLGRCRDKEAIIVDTRHNGGGWLHDDVCTLLSGKGYEDFVPQGRLIGHDPYNKWLRPSCMMICEDNYSNAHGTPWVYKTLGIGKLIGSPTPGTMTAVWWERQIDSSIVFGIPQVGCRDMKGQFLENQLLNPDILIYNTPANFINGEDKQLEGAVQEMLREVGNTHK